MKLTGKIFLMLLLYSPTKKGNYNIPIHGRTRLMKMGFLFDREVKKIFEKDKTFDEIVMPEFFAWYYGPFSKDLLTDLEFLINQQYIEVKLGKDSPLLEEKAEYKYWIEDLDDNELYDYDEEIFSLTSENGVKKGEEIWSVLTKNQIQLLIDFKNTLNSAPLSRILTYVYKKYEVDGITYKSLIKERFLK